MRPVMKRGRRGAAQGGLARRSRGKPWPGGAGRRAASTIVVLALALTAGGCESNVERSAQLARHTRHAAAAQRGLVVTRENPHVRVLATVVLHDANGTAAVVTLRNDSARPLRNVPVAIALHGAHGQTLYQNNAPGLSAALVSTPLLRPGQPFDWIDDQLPASAATGSVSVRVGEAPAAAGEPLQLSIEGVRLSEEAAGGQSVEGNVVNHSAVAQPEVVVFAVGRRGGTIVAAGRAVLPNVPAHSATPFQVFFVGNPRGAALQVSAPPTALG
jgi:hypothetical protein